MRIAEVHLAAMEILAPADGQVLEVLKHAGEGISNTMPEAVRLFAPAGPLEVRAQVDEAFWWMFSFRGLASERRLELACLDAEQAHGAGKMPELRNSLDGGSPILPFLGMTATEFNRVRRDPNVRLGLEAGDSHFVVDPTVARRFNEDTDCAHCNKPGMACGFTSRNFVNQHCVGSFFERKFDGGPFSGIQLCKLRAEQSGILTNLKPIWEIASPVTDDRRGHRDSRIPGGRCLDR